jgi:hypothetical protein
MPMYFIRGTFFYHTVILHPCEFYQTPHSTFEDNRLCYDFFIPNAVDNNWTHEIL